VLKLDYEKSYDRVDWSFLEEILSTRGFGVKWRSWVVMKLVKGGSIAIRINDINSPYTLSLVRTLGKRILYPSCSLTL
jgi:hypothetical protein